MLTTTEERRLREEKITIKYTKEISKLTGNSRPIIDFLTTLAKDLAKNNPHYASIIVNIIESRLRQIKPELKLATLYLLDSIVKNVKQPYIDLFARNLVSNVHYTYGQVPDSTKVKLLKLRSTWKHIFSSCILSELEKVPSTSSPNVYQTTSASNSPYVVYSPMNDFTMVSPRDDDEIAQEKLRQDILQREKELAELRKKKIELQLKAARSKLEESDHSQTEQYGSHQQDEEVIFEQQMLQQMEPAAFNPEIIVIPSPSSQQQSNRPLHAVIPQTNLHTQKSLSKLVNDDSKSLEDKENKHGEEKELDATTFVSELIKLGIIPSPSSSEGSSNDSDIMQGLKNNPEKGKIKGKKRPIDETAKTSVNSEIIHPPVEVVNMGFENMKERRDKLIIQLFSGMKCTSCGIRFPYDQRDKYSEHLDWHFRKNRRKRFKSTKIVSQKWYCKLSDWKQYLEVEDSDERAPSLFESHSVVQKEVLSKSKKRKLSRTISECTLPATGRDRTTSCPHCSENFYMYYDDEKEEWRFKDARLGTDDEGVEQIFHNECWQEYSSSSLPLNVRDIHVDLTVVTRQEKVDHADPTLVTTLESTSILKGEMLEEEKIVDEKGSSQQSEIISLVSPVMEIEMETGENVQDNTVVVMNHPSIVPFRVRIQDSFVEKSSSSGSPNNNSDHQCITVDEDDDHVVVQERKFFKAKPRLDQNTILRNIPPKQNGRETSGLCTIC